MSGDWNVLIVCAARLGQQSHGALCYKLFVREMTSSDPYWLLFQVTDGAGWLADKNFADELDRSIKL